MAGLTDELNYIQYDHSLESKYLPAIRSLIAKDLSEPYSIYVYRYFLCQWGHLCFMVLDSDASLVGVIICKLEADGKGIVAVDEITFSFLSAVTKTYHEVAHIGDEAGGQGIEKAVDAELAELRKVDEVVALREEAGGDEAEETAEEENG
ncbi:hypothetical protein BN1723_011436, partial [Verticillium longisporum]